MNMYIELLPITYGHSFIYQKKAA